MKNNSEQNLPVKMDMISHSIADRRIAYATNEALSPLDAASHALASLQSDRDFVDIEIVKNVLLCRLKDMIDKKDTSSLQEFLYSQVLILDSVFKHYILQAAKHPEKHQGLAALALKAQRQSRATVEALAGLITPKEPQTLIQNNSVINQQANNAVGDKKVTNELLDSP
jgi:hypothetical protein